VWLGNTRLAIQDLSNLGHQPMRSADRRYTLIYNGELYNNTELRSRLSKQGAVFHSGSDTETLLQAYILYGSDCLQHLNGIFAFAVYDSLTETLFVARDPLGIKPLYYYQDEHHFLFASELKAIAHMPELDYTLRPEVFYNYLLFLYSPGTETPFRHVHKLLPGHSIRITKGIAEQPSRYYQLPFNGMYDYKASKGDWIAATDKALYSAVQRQLISDAPVGFFLSGGLDSSLIAAMAHSQQPDCRQVCFTVDTGSALAKEGFSEDLRYARIVAQKLAATLTEVPGKTAIADKLDAMVWHLDEPQADPAALHVWHIARAAKAQGIKVLLGGTGADDVFSGYRRHQLLGYEGLMNLIPSGLFKVGSLFAKSAGRAAIARRMDKLTHVTGSTIKKRIGTHFWLPPQRVEGLFFPGLVSTFTEQQPFQYFKQLLSEIPAEQSPLNQMLYWEMNTFLPAHNLNYTDKMSMAAGVEARVPYLDVDLIALSTRMPPELKMNGQTTKYILREVAKKYLPQEVINRKKTGFAAPLRQWITSDLKPLIRKRLLSGSLVQWDIFDPQAIAALVQDNEHGRIDAAYSIFALLAIESWLRQFAIPPTVHSRKL
jgi:asparagine synthase (glutamine-hydrolysing)